MASMYEKIMELPLFKGIGEEQLNQMLEKTSIEFLKFADGELIKEAGSPVRSLDFILKGEVRNTYKLLNYEIEVDEIITDGGVIGATQQYGLDTSSFTTSRAKGDVSLMRIDKAQYMNILQSDKIYLLNYMNYLSAAAQNSLIMMLDQGEPGIRRSLENLTGAIASRGAGSVVLVAEDSTLADYCGVEEEEFTSWKELEIAKGTLKAAGRGIELVD